MTLIQSLGMKAASIGDSDLVGLAARLREKIEQLESAATALDDLVRASRASVAYQVRPEPLALALDRADHLLETLHAR
jgi:hypothetical protein